MDSDNFDKISDKTQQPGEPYTSMLKSYNNYVQYSLINNLSLNKKELTELVHKNMIFRASNWYRKGVRLWACLGWNSVRGSEAKKPSTSLDGAFGYR